MSEATEPSGVDILKANMAAFEAGEEVPYVDGVDLEQVDPPKKEEEEIVEEVEEEEVVEEELDEVEEIAKKDGYMTKEEWVASGKDADDYMTKEEFAKVGELRDGDETRQSLSKQYVQMESTLQEVLKNQNDMLEKARQDEREKVLSELKEKKQEAIDFQDAEGAAKIEREIVKHELEDGDKKEEVTNQPPQAMVDWHSQNASWFENDVNARGLLLAELSKQEKAGKPFEEGIVEAEAKVKKAFPYHFGDVETPARKRVNDSERSRKKPSKERKKTFADLDPEMRAVAKKAAKASKMTEEEYMETFNV